MEKKNYKSSEILEKKREILRDIENLKKILIKTHKDMSEFYDIMRYSEVDIPMEKYEEIYHVLVRPYEDNDISMQLLDLYESLLDIERRKKNA